MRTTLSRALAVGALAFTTATVAFAQDTTRNTIGLDPYKPSDAKILREQGPAVVTQMTIEEIKKLDPYNPTDAALLRQMGGAIPVCCLDLLGTSVQLGGVYLPRLPLASVTPTMKPAPVVAGQVWVCRGAACAATFK